MVNESFEYVQRYIDETGIKKGTETYSRRYEQKLIRFYLFAYLRDRGCSFWFIANMFNLNHATVISGIKSWNNLKRYPDVVELTDEVRFLFPMNVESVIPSMEIRMVHSLTSLEKYMNKKMKKIYELDR